MEAMATAAGAREPGEGCEEPSPGHWGELSCTPVASRPQDKVEAVEGAPRAPDGEDAPEAKNAAVSAMLRAVAGRRPAR
nr:unnamed protein product [Camelus bactrianus]